MSGYAAPEATLDAALLNEDQWKLAQILRQLEPHLLEHEKRPVAGAIAFPEELDWRPYLSLIFVHLLQRRMEQLEKRLMHRVIDVGASRLADAIAEGDHEKAEAAAVSAFKQAEQLLSQEETEG
jgi:hypothetical protein